MWETGESRELGETRESWVTRESRGIKDKKILLDTFPKYFFRDSLYEELTKMCVFIREVS